MQWFFVAIGGAVGAMFRFGLSRWLYDVGQGIWPVATFAANVLGSAAMGVLYVLVLERAQLPPDIRYAGMIGLLGAFTTFSTFSLEAIVLLEAGRIGTAIGYVVVTLLMCLAGCYAAMSITRAL